METLKKLWTAFSGRKTYTAVVIWLVVGILADMDVISAEQAEFVTKYIVTGLFGVGVTHKLLKGE